MEYVSACFLKMSFLQATVHSSLEAYNFIVVTPVSCIEIK
jgi:hypothetical protein